MCNACEDLRRKWGHSSGECALPPALSCRNSHEHEGVRDMYGTIIFNVSSQPQRRPRSSSPLPEEGNFTAYYFSVLVPIEGNRTVPPPQSLEHCSTVTK